MWQVDGDRRRLEQIGALAPAFLVDVDGATYDSDEGLARVGVRAEASVRSLGPGVDELTLCVVNESAESRTVSRADPLVLAPMGPWKVTGFTSAWGAEFEPIDLELTTPVRLETRTGRSGNGSHPILLLERPGCGVVITVAWSGNWHIDVGLPITAGISPWHFATTLAPGETFEAPSVVVATGESLAAASRSLASAVDRDWCPMPASPLGVEWNHWWPYEDAEIDEETFLANARVAAELGAEVATVDAGWFGPSDPTTEWGHYRGDWELVNTQRFPSGIAALADGTRAAGLDFGIWAEHEAIGPRSALRSHSPELVARDGGQRSEQIRLGMDQFGDPEDPGFLGYLCLGSPAGRERARQVLEDLVATTGFRWIKLDFNIDPGAGCTRTDHGHGPLDGLYHHYRGLYEVLDEFREAHPEVVLEACSSGGLRIDLGLARHLHCLFLSDPDWTEHHLQLVWGAATILPARAILHWMCSEWRTHHRYQNLDLRTPTVSRAEFDLIVRAAMVHWFGMSLKLIEMDSAYRSRLAEHIAFYKQIRPLLVHGVITPLSGRPRRFGEGERFPRLQVSSADGFVLAAYCLDERPDCALLRPEGLDSKLQYRLTDPDGHFTGIYRGRELMNQGLTLRTDAATRSWLFMLTPCE